MNKIREREIRFICDKYGFEILEMELRTTVRCRLRKNNQVYWAFFSCTPSSCRSDRNAISGNQLHPVRASSATATPASPRHR